MRNIALIGIFLLSTILVFFVFTHKSEVGSDRLASEVFNAAKDRVDRAIRDLPSLVDSEQLAALTASDMDIHQVDLGDYIVSIPVGIGLRIYKLDAAENATRIFSNDFSDSCQRARARDLCIGPATGDWREVTYQYSEVVCISSSARTELINEGCDGLHLRLRRSRYTGISQDEIYFQYYLQDKNSQLYSLQSAENKFFLISSSEYGISASTVLDAEVDISIGCSSCGQTTFIETLANVVITSKDLQEQSIEKLTDISSPRFNHTDRHSRTGLGERSFRL